MKEQKTKSRAETAQTPCPHCGQPLDLEIWLIVDAAERPDLLERVREGTIHEIACPHCGRSFAVDAPLLIFRPPTGSEPAGGPPLLFSPAQQTTAEQDQEALTALIAHLQESLGDAWQDGWLAEGLPGVPRQLLPLALGADLSGLEDLTGLLQAQAEAELERLRREDPETYRQLEEAAEALRQMVEAAHIQIPAGLDPAGGSPAEKLVAWIQTPDWRSSEEYLTQHAAELLTDEAEAELERLRQINPNVEAIPEHQGLLRRAREVGIAAMYAEIRRKRLLQSVEQALQQYGPIGAAVWRYIQAKDDEAAALLQREKDLLLTWDAGEMLRQLVEALSPPPPQGEGEGGRAEDLAARLRARYEQWQAAHAAYLGGPLRPAPAEPEGHPRPQPEQWTAQAQRQPLQAERSSTYTVLRASQCAIGDNALVINNIGRLPLRWRRPAEGRPRLARIAVGRQVELEELHSRLSGGQSTAVVGKGTSAALRGQPAIGKTTLAAMYVARYGDRYPGGTLWLDVGPDRRSADDVLPILQRIAVYAYDADAQARQMLENTTFAPDVVRALLDGHGAMLVVIDDVWDVAALRTLQDALPGDASILLTTRDYRVAHALEDSPTAIQELDVLTLPDAVALLQRGAPGLPDDLAKRIAAGLGCHALALTLAAGALAFRRAHRYEQTAAELLRRVAEGRGFGDLPRMDRAERLSAVEIAFHYSYDELGKGREGERRQAWFRALGAFAQEADFEGQAAAAVWELEPQLAQEFLLLLDGLSLIHETDRDRWQQHALLRAYALSLQTGEERARFARRHADYYLHLTQACYESVPRDYDRVEREFAQIQHAFAWCERHSPRRATRLALLLNDFMRVRSRIGLLDQWLHTALEGAELHGDRLGKANTLKSLGDLEFRLGNIAQARAHYDAALPLYEAEQARLGKANTLQSLGDLESRLGNIAQARAHYDAALPLYEAAQDRLGKANTLQSLGDLEFRLGNIAQARAHYDAALPLYEAEQDPVGKMNTWVSLARLEAGLGNIEEARGYYRRTFALAEEVDFGEHPVVQGWKQEFALLTGGSAAQALVEKLVAWLQTPDWQSSEEYLAQYADELLTEEAEEMLALLQQANPDVAAIPRHQVLLRRCREIGIEGAYRELHAALAGQPPAGSEPAGGSAVEAVHE